MDEHDLNPVPDTTGLDGVDHYQTSDDIELPSGRSRSAPEVEWSGGARRAKKSWLPKFAGIAVLGALLVASWFAFPKSLEKQHPNWQHVAAAAQASGADEQLAHLNGQSVSNVVPSIEVTSSDAARMATRRIRSALLRDDFVTATGLLQGVQTIPTASANPNAKPPILADGSPLTKLFKNSKTELYQIELFDCCHEDGDIIEVTVNGCLFATVPITNGGTMVSVPLARGNNTIGIRAATDGGGGVTVSFRTSRGDFFARNMREGAEHQIGVVVQ